MMEDEIRQRLLNAQIINVTAIFEPGKNDRLILTLSEGDAVSIEADGGRLRLFSIAKPEPPEGDSYLWESGT